MIIQEFELFDGISGKMEEEIATAMNTESYKAGDVIIKEGDPAENFFILRNGVLDVKVAGAKRSTHVAVRPGEAVGWSSLAGRETYTASVRSVEPSTVLRINKHSLDDILRRYPSEGLLFYKRLSRLVGERLIQCYGVMGELQEKGT
jgi:CRP/FNR family cyclic AMP-dependent transcriptional regulator